MKNQYKEYLFRKNTLVSDQTEECSPVDVLYALITQFGIRVIDGAEFATQNMIHLAESVLGISVPEPFYRGFPQSVRALSPDMLLYDQLLHYKITYGMGMFDKEWHSLFETLIERTPFQEDVKMKDFIIVREENAVNLLGKSINELLSSSRPLSIDNYELLKNAVQDYDINVENCASKDTAVKLLADTRDLQFVKFLRMSDVMRLLEVILDRDYKGYNIKKLNLKNKDRKFIRDVINRLFEVHRCDITTCYEKKADWAGLLHHVHYEPINEYAQKFTAAMRGNENKSVYAKFEREMAKRDIHAAVSTLNNGKGSAGLLRQLDYIVSRCETDEEIQYVLDQIQTNNLIVLIQLIQKYVNRDENREIRVFRFVKHNRLKQHEETKEEALKRRSYISEGYSQIIGDCLMKKLQETLKGKLGLVYIDPEMEYVAVPLQESMTLSGYGVLPRGSRISIEEGKIIRAFTYWEKADDIDLSCFLLDEDCRNKIEFSWRTMWNEQSQELCFSGDETSGFHGGSEYFDIDIIAMRKKYPDKKYLILCDNVYSEVPFNECVCSAGYMLRDGMESGEVFEPATVKSSFRINCNSMFAFLFAIDLKNNMIIWLNMAFDSEDKVAGMTDFSFLSPYMHCSETINMKVLAEMMATVLVDTPEEAETVFSNRLLELQEGIEQIHSYDIDRLLSLLNS